MYFPLFLSWHFNTQTTEKNQFTLENSKLPIKKETFVITSTIYPKKAVKSKQNPLHVASPFSSTFTCILKEYVNTL